jgi:hypothetical protein
VLYGTFDEYGRHLYGFSTSMLMYKFLHTDLVSCRISSSLESRSTVSPLMPSDIQGVHDNVCPTLYEG